MHCPFCNADDTKVIDSRLGNDGTQVRRRRECTKCSERFTTFESAELAMPKIIKRDGIREVFCDKKLRTGIMRALEKRPVNSESVEEAIGRITRRLRESGEREVEASILGEYVMEQLQALDQVAYVRFASVYRAFKDVNEFKEEINKLIKKEKENDKN